MRYTGHRVKHVRPQYRLLGGDYVPDQGCARCASAVFKKSQLRKEPGTGKVVCPECFDSVYNKDRGSSVGATGEQTLVTALSWQDTPATELLFNETTALEISANYYLEI